MNEPLTQDRAPDSSRLLEPVRHPELHADLDRWRANVGTPVALQSDLPAAPCITGVDVLSWNLAIGRARLAELLDRLTAGELRQPGTAPERPFVILAQEAYRADASVPPLVGSAHHGGVLPQRERTDIVALAASRGLSLRYAPSMRNGPAASDRGNAILSNVQLSDATSFLLPYVRQRRVVVTSRIRGHPYLTFLSAHLDTHGRPALDPAARRFGAGRAAQARELGRAIAAAADNAVLGADLNSVFGMTDPAVRALADTGLHPARRIGSWRHTFPSFRLLLDHVMYRCSDDIIERVEVTRLEDPQRTRGSIFGSDHYPLLARVELRADCARS